MPTPNRQTLATAKYQSKAGYVTKSFKMKREVVEKFVEKCEKTGTSQAAWLTEKMEEFIREDDNGILSVGRI